MPKEKFVFIDRDGVINRDPGGWTEYGYVTRWEDFYFLPKVLDTLKRFTDSGYGIIFISNQQGVGKGYFSKEDLAEVTANLKKEVEKRGARIAGIYYCTHAKEESCDCRKPKPGLFYEAQKELKIKDIPGKFFIGDTERDVKAGRAAGLRTILVLSGKAKAEDIKTWEYKPDHVCESLAEAADVVIGNS